MTKVSENQTEHSLEGCRTKYTYKEKGKVKTLTYREALKHLRAKKIAKLRREHKITDLEEAILLLALDKPSLFKTFGVIKINKGID